MSQSESIVKIAAAFTKAQQDIKIAHKAENNPFFKSKYADLTAVWDAVKDALGKNELAVMQIPTVIGEHQFLRTRLIHSSGEWIEGVYIINPVKNDPQGIGSAITYARRYSLCAMLGVIADEDDDGNKASGLNEKDAWKQRRVEHNDRKAEYIIEAPSDSVGVPDYYLFAGEFEAAVESAKSMEEVTLIKAANSKILNAIKRDDAELFERLKAAAGEAGNKHA